MKNYTHIVSNPEVMTGMPCIRGTRITVANILRQVATGRTVQQICHDYPSLSGEQIAEAIEFAADIASYQTYELLAS